MHDYKPSTGCSIWKKSERIGCSTETVHIWPHVGKAEMRLSGRSFLNNCKQTAEKCKQKMLKLKKLPPIKHILALSKRGQICTISVLQPILSFYLNIWPFEILNCSGYFSFFFSAKITILISFEEMPKFQIQQMNAITLGNL